MKKFFVTMLSMAVLMSASVTAFAADGGGNKETVGETSKIIAVNATYTDNTSDAGKKVSVDVQWDSMEFTYDMGTTKAWNPEKHAYDYSAAGWKETTGKNITVTNHSNVDVNATFAYAEKETKYADVDGTFTYDKNDTDNVVKLVSAVGKEVNQADKVTATLKLSGALPSDTTSSTQIGTVTVTIAEATQE